jgi:hypothetical protein
MAIQIGVSISSLLLVLMPLCWFLPFTGRVEERTDGVFVVDSDKDDLFFLVLDDMVRTRDLGLINTNNLVAILVLDLVK